MKRFKLTVAYDGTNYCGWQIQPSAPTIEGELNKALCRLTGETIQMIGASRTDAGVHAYGNVAVFDSDTPIPGEKLLFALNPHLPEDIRIVDSCEVAADFHPRYCDTRKTYEYHIQTGRTPLPTKRLYSHWLPHRLDVAAMNEAAKYLVGTHDFKSFCAAQTQVKTTVRTVLGIAVEERFSDGVIPLMKNIGEQITEEQESMDLRCGQQSYGQQSHGQHPDKIFAPDKKPENKHPQDIIIRVEGEGFLYNMVRIISGTLIKVGLHGWQPEYVKEILASRDRTRAGETAPAKGLFLKKIEYPEKIR